MPSKRVKKTFSKPIIHVSTTQCYLRQPYLNLTRIYAHAERGMFLLVSVAWKIVCAHFKMLVALPKCFKTYEMPFQHVKCEFLGRSFSRLISQSCSFGCTICGSHCTQNPDACNALPNLKSFFFYSCAFRNHST